MGNRRKVPETTQADVLTSSRRRCCICVALNADEEIKQGQIAHLDRDASNNSEANLVFLCMLHHDQYDTRTSQSKNFTLGEVKRYRDELYSLVSDGFPDRPLHPSSRIHSQEVQPGLVFKIRDCDGFVHPHTGTQFEGVTISNQSSTLLGDVQVSLAHFHPHHEDLYGFPLLLSPVHSEIRQPRFSLQPKMSKSLRVLSMDMGATHADLHLAPEEQPVRLEIGHYTIRLIGSANEIVPTEQSFGVKVARGKSSQTLVIRPIAGITVLGGGSRGGLGHAALGTTAVAVLRIVSGATHTENKGIFISDLQEVVGAPIDELVFEIESLMEHKLVAGTSFTLKNEGINQRFRSEWRFWATKKGRKYLFETLRASDIRREPSGNTMLLEPGLRQT